MNPNRALRIKPGPVPRRLDRAAEENPRKSSGSASEQGQHRRPVKRARTLHAGGRFARAPQVSPRVGRLSASEERSLADRIKVGDADALEQLITANLALVLRAVSGYKQRGASVDDLVQEGNLGLIRAARHFDPSTHTARFATYAKYWIRAFIVRALSSNGSLIQIPENSHLLRLQYRRALGELSTRGAARNGNPSSKPPSLDEIASYLGVPPHRLKRARLTQTEQSIRLRLGDLMVADGPAPDQGVVINEDRALVAAALRRLSPFESWVICERFGLDEPTAVRGLRRAALRRNAARKKTGSAITAKQQRSTSIHGPQTAASYYQRSYIDMGRDCGLSVRRLQQVEKTALDKLRGFLGRRAAESTRPNRGN
jgi:RNA polymerase primary sigma factor